MAGTRLGHGTSASLAGGVTLEFGEGGFLGGVSVVGLKSN